VASTEVFIGNADGQHVLIRPRARRHPGLFDDQDVNWIECEVEVAAGAFRGALRLGMRTDDLSAFLDEVVVLEGGADGAATLTPTEGQLSIALARDADGRLHVTGEAIDAADVVNRLQFAFEIDEAGLADTRRSLEHLLAAYPVVGAAGA